MYASLTFHQPYSISEEFCGMDYTYLVIKFLPASEQFACIRLASPPPFASSYVRVYVQLPRCFAVMLSKMQFSLISILIGSAPWYSVFSDAARVI